MDKEDRILANALEETLERNRILATTLEETRIRATTLIGLRNIAWAAEQKQHGREYAKVVKSITQLLIDHPGNVGIVRTVLRENKQYFWN